MIGKNEITIDVSLTEQEKDKIINKIINDINRQPSPHYFVSCAVVDGSHLTKIEKGEK